MCLRACRAGRTDEYRQNKVAPERVRPRHAVAPRRGRRGGSGDGPPGQPRRSDGGRQRRRDVVRDGREAPSGFGVAERRGRPRQGRRPHESRRATRTAGRGSVTLHCHGSAGGAGVHATRTRPSAAASTARSAAPSRGSTAPPRAHGSSSTTSPRRGSGGAGMYSTQSFSASSSAASTTDASPRNSSSTFRATSDVPSLSVSVGGASSPKADRRTARNVDASPLIVRLSARSRSRCAGAGASRRRPSGAGGRRGRPSFVFTTVLRQFWSTLVEQRRRVLPLDSLALLAVCAGHRSIARVSLRWYGSRSTFNGTKQTAYCLR